MFWAFFHMPGFLLVTRKCTILEVGILRLSMALKKGIHGTFAEHVAPQDEVPFLCARIVK